MHYCANFGDKGLLCIYTVSNKKILMMEESIGNSVAQIIIIVHVKAEETFG